MRLYDVQVVEGDGFRTDTVTGSLRYAIERREYLFTMVQAARVIRHDGTVVP